MPFVWDITKTGDIQIAIAIVKGKSGKIVILVNNAGVALRAIEAGVEVISPAKDYEYGYRQGEIKDPFGHVWMIEMKI